MIATSIRPAAALVMSLLTVGLMPAAATFAQDTAGSPAPAPSAAAVDGDFAEGMAINGTSIISGPDLIAQLDPTDPRQAQDIEDIQAMLEATGKGLDQLTMLNAVGEDGKTFVGAIRIEGADQQIVKEMFLQSMFRDLELPRQVDKEIGGKSVAQVFEDADASLPPLTVYAASEVVWLISGTEEAAAAILQTLP